MCTNTHTIYNPYIRRHILVNCGRCPACIQDKADARAARIRNNVSKDTIDYFVTLTYKNKYIPTIKRSDFLPSSTAVIYRHKSPFSKDSKKRDFPIGSVDITYLPLGFDEKFLRVPENYHYGDNISVPFYKDVQDFFKRLRINLFRNPDLENIRNQYANKIIPIKYYACCELGPTTHRAHIHLNLSVPKALKPYIRNLVNKAWPFASASANLRNIKEAVAASSYVASYVNCDSSIPHVFRTPYLKCKHSYSKDYGLNLFEFQPLEILKAVERGTLRLYKPSSFSTFGTNYILFPKYALSRLFPQFKGYGRFPLGSLFQFFQRLESFAKVVGKDYDEECKYPCMTFCNVGYTASDCHKIYVSLRNHARNFCRRVNRCAPSKYPFKIYDYFLLFERVWRVYESSKMINFYDDMEHRNVKLPFAAFYDNVAQLKDVMLSYPIPSLPEWSLEQDFGILHDSKVFPDKDIEKYLDPNLNPLRVVMTARTEDRYHKMYKRRKVTNLSMSQMGYNV